MNSPEDRLATRLMQEVADRAPTAPDWSEVVDHLAAGHSTAERPAIRRPWLLAATAAGVAAAVALGAVVYQRSGADQDSSVVIQTASTTATTSSATPVPSMSAPATTPGDSSSVVSDGPAFFLPSTVPAGFSVVEASTHDGVPAYVLPFVSAETWISRDDGQITGIVRLTANQRFEPPNLQPREPTGLTVHGEVAQMLTPPDAAGGTGVTWDEQHLTLFVSSWGPDAVAIAEQSVVSTLSGITLRAGALPDEFVRVETEPRPSLAGRTSSSVQWATDDGAATLSLSAQPNSKGETTDTLGSTPGFEPRTAGARQVWLKAGDGTASAVWLEGDYVLSVGGKVDEDALLAFVVTIQRATQPAFDSVVAQASAIDQAVTERDRAVFADGLEVSMHSDAPIDVPETSSFGPRSLCVTGDRTICDRVTPYTEGGLLVMVAATRTIDGERELLLWTANSRTVTRAFEWDTEVDFPIISADGAAGTFVRVTAPADVRTIVVQFHDTGEPGLGAEFVNLDPADQRANVLTPEAPAG